MRASQPPPSVKDLSADAKNYNYSDNIKLKLWISTLSYLLVNSNNYLRQNYFGESYKQKIRFCEIMLNKLSHHPEVKAFKKSQLPMERQIYKEYTILHNKINPVLEEIDQLKKIIDKNYNDYLDLKKKSDNFERLQEEKYLQQRRLYQSNDVSIPRNKSDNDKYRDDNDNMNNNNTNLNDDDDDDDQFFQTLKTPILGHNNGNHLNDNSDLPQYPSLPNFNNNMRDDNNFRYEFPSKINDAPKLPTKENVPSSLLQSNSPPLPLRQHQGEASADVGGSVIEHKTVNFTEGGSPLRTIFVSSDLQKEFLKISQRNTSKKLETCGILAGKLSRNAFFITHLLIPEQISTANSCETMDEEDLFLTVDKYELFILGWIHTHPTQSCFLSSVDLHTQNSYQIMLNELIAIVLSPDERFKQRDFGCFRLTDPPGLPTISRCNRTGFHPHEEQNLYVTCNRVNNDIKMGHVVIKDRLPFEVIDLRKKKAKVKK